MMTSASAARGILCAEPPEAAPRAVVDAGEDAAVTLIEATISDADAATVALVDASAPMTGRLPRVSPPRIGQLGSIDEVVSAALDRDRITVSLSAPDPGFARSSRPREREQLAHATVLLDGVTERKVAVDFIGGPPALALAREVARILELREDALHGPLGDAHRRGEIADARRRVLCDAEQDVGVVGEEGPRGRHGRGRR